MNTIDFSAKRNERRNRATLAMQQGGIVALARLASEVLAEARAQRAAKIGNNKQK